MGVTAIVRHPAPDHKSNVLRPSNRAHFLDSLTGTPPTDADERFFHNDLPCMSAAAQWRELTVISLRLALDLQPHWWWIERDRRIREELRHRGCPTT
jgi:hypothetical protein